MLSWRQREPGKDKVQFKIITISCKTKAPTPKQAEILKFRHSYRCTLSPEIFSTSLPFLLTRPLLTYADLPSLLAPKAKLIVKAEICFVRSVTNFFLRYAKHTDDFEEVGRLCGQLGSTMENISDRVFRLLMREGHLFVTKNKETGLFCRVVILEVHTERKIAKVQYIDIGKIECVAFERLRFICSPFLKLLTFPPLAISSCCDEKMYQDNSAERILYSLVKNEIYKKLVFVEVLSVHGPAEEGPLILKNCLSVLIHPPSRSHWTQREKWRKD